MKKVKTILASLVVILASVLMSACSCGDSGVPQVYVTDINLRCLTETENVKSTLSGGILNIECHVDDTFKIEYALTPADATMTQVSWEFSDKGLVAPKNKGDYTRSKSTTEIVEFVAQGRSLERYQTTLTFTANITSSGRNGTEKMAICNITVYDRVSELPTFSQPSNISFESKNNTIEWSRVTSVIEGGDRVNNNPTLDGNGYPRGLQGYEVALENIDTGETTTNFISLNKNSFEMPNTGVAYNVKVRALGDGKFVKSGEYTDDFRFYKLNEVSNLKNDNGYISFTTPAKSTQNRIYFYEGEDKNQYKEIGTTELSPLEVNAKNDFKGYQNIKDKFTVEVVSYPENYNSEYGYAEIDGVRYYPSTPKTPLTIQKLTAPVVSLSDRRENITVGGVSFESRDESSRPHASTRVSWRLEIEQPYESIYKQKYSYTIYGDNLASEVTGTTAEPYCEISNLKAGGEYTIKVKTVGDETNTIESEEVTFKFTIADHLDGDSLSLDGDTVLNNEDVKTGGLELFFVYQGNNVQANSRRVELIQGSLEDAYNISLLGLTPGEYKVYGKSIYSVGENTNVAVIVPLDGEGSPNYAELMEIKVASAVRESDTYILPSGTLQFPQVTGIGEYNIILKQTGEESVENSTIVFPVFTAKAGEATGNMDIQYTLDGTTIKVDLVEIFRKYLRNVLSAGGEVVTEEDINSRLIQYLNSTNVFTCQVQSKGFMGSGLNVISSIPTYETYFNRCGSVENVVLNNYELSFSGVEGVENYQIKLLISYDPNSIDNATEYIFAHAGMWSKNESGKIVTNLRNDESFIDGETTMKLADLINPTAFNWISITAKGSRGKALNPATLDSTPTETLFKVTHRVTDLALNQSGELSWKTTSNETSDTYTLYFSKVEIVDGVVTDTELNEETVSGVGGQQVSITDDAKTLKTHIGAVLAKYPDQVIAISIVENNAGKFSNIASVFFYATRISAPTLEYKLDESDYRIAWKSIANADNYIVSVTKQNDESFRFDPINGGELFFSISQRIDDANSAWTEGVYTISVVAGSFFADSSTAEEPFVLTSVASEKIVRIVSKQLDVTVSDQTISWENVCVGTDVNASYSVAYSTTASITEGFVYSTDRSRLSLKIGEKLAVGVNTITITPTVGFEETGFILIRDLKENSVTKWDTAKSLTVVGGNLQFKVYGATNNEAVQIELYENDALVSNNLYKIISSDPVTEESTTYILYIIALDGLNAGELTLKARIKSEGKISSELSSSVTGTKIASVTDLDKTGDWLNWSSQAGISSYDLAYKHINDTEYSTIHLVVEESDGGYKTFVKKPDTTNEYIEDNTKAQFYYENGKFYYKFDESLIVNGKTGDILITIRPLTEIVGYFSGNTSAPITSTKLNSDTQISIEDGKIHIADYEADGSATPDKYILTIYKLEISEGEEGSESTTIRRTETLYTTGESSYTNNENTANIAPIDLNTIGLQEAGNYEIELRYLGNGNKVLHSEVITDNTLIKLDTTSISTQSGQITWANSDNAENYTLEISDGTSTQLITIQKGEGATVVTEDQLIYTLPTTEPEIAPQAEQLYILQAGKIYTLRVMANASGKLHSKWSEPFKIKKLYAPTDLAVTSNTAVFNVGGEEEIVVPEGAPIVTWVNINSTNVGQAYTMKYSDEQIINIPETTLRKYILDTSYVVADYNLQLRVLGSTTENGSTIGLLTSDYSTALKLHYVRDVYNNLKVSGGKISWDSVDGAYSYKVSAYKQTTTDEGSEYVLAFTTYTAQESIDFSKINPNTQASQQYGNYTFRINAITDPKLAIVSTNADIEVVEVSLYKPNVFKNFKVKNGMLNWQVPISDVRSFVSENMETIGTLLAEQIGNVSININTVLSAGIQYILNRINVGDPIIEALDNNISHLVRVQLNINNVVSSDTPTSVQVVDSDGNPVTVISEYATKGHALEYSYNVANDPEIEDLTPEEGGAETGTETISLPSARNTTEEGYVAGRYQIKLSAIGNTDADTPVVDGGYTQSLIAYKPTTPKTWSSSGSDVDMGKVQWGLSTTPNSTLTAFDYYKDYRISAVTLDGVHKAYQDISVQDTVVGEINPNLHNNYQYYRDFKWTGTADSNNKGLFTTSDVKVGSNNLEYNKYYRLLINTIGTKDSSLLTGGEYIYLNSNACVVGAPVNILNTSKDPEINASRLRWQTSNGSTKTRVFIYGPFDNLDSSGKTRNVDWVTNEASDVQLDKIYLAYNGDTEGLSTTYSITDATEIANLAKLLKVVDIGIKDGARINEYTLTDNDTYAEGGYVFKFQELGDGKGVVDSVISSYTKAAEKLATPKRQSAGWVGVGTSNVYVWDPTYSNGNLQQDIWSITTKYDVNTPNQKVGTFVWEPVAGANAYKVSLWRQAENGETESLDVSVVTRETRYEPESGVIYNDPNCKYFIKIYAIRLECGAGDSLEDFYVRGNSDIALADNFFSSDCVDTTAYARLSIPANLTIYDNGKIDWNGGVEYANIGGYYIKFAYNEEVNIKDTTSTASTVPAFELNSVGGNYGTIAIAIKTVAQDSSGSFLNSSYCKGVEVTRLADPNVRLENGVFYWGWAEGADPLTDSELYIDASEDSPEPIIIEQETKKTSLQYFTDITEHNKNYTSGGDVAKYPEGTHEFKVRFKGTGGSTGTSLSGSGNFYIASNQKTLSAYKLSSPSIENVTLKLAETSENMVQWNPIENALGYRVRVFYSNQETYSEYDITSAELSSTELTSDYFTSGNGKVYFKLTKVIDESGLKTTGGELYIYVQAIGSGMGESAIPEFSGSTQNKLYLSSSYSDCRTIGVPPQPTNISYDSNTGIVSWAVNNADGSASTSAYGIKLQTDYKVKDVSASDFANYWAVSSHKINAEQKAPTYNPLGDKLINRSITYTTDSTTGEVLYQLTVSDILYLPVENVYNSITGAVSGQRTPTSYTITTVGYDYKFTVTAISFAPGSAEEKDFASPSASSNSGYTFALFDKGDGSEGYPYTVKDYEQFNTIRLFTDRHYELVADIAMKDGNKEQTWQTISNTFTGSIKGNSKTISDFKMSPATYSNADNYALFVNNAGIISDINISTNSTITGVHTGLKVATIAIYNSGTISGVTVTGAISLKPEGITSSDIHTAVGGIVYENNGTISNISVDAIISSLDDTNNPAYAGGIAVDNYGKIEKSHFAGSLTSNYVGGIAVQNYGGIERCYVDNATINGTDKSQSASVLKTSVIGGISAFIYAPTSTEDKDTAYIKYSYSRATIYVAKGTSNNTTTIGGLVASIANSEKVKISGNYVESKIAGEADNFATNGVTKYDMLHSASAITANDNYYTVTTVTGTEITSATSNAGTKKDTLADLRTALAGIVDGSDAVFDTTSESAYPTLR